MPASPSKIAGHGLYEESTATLSLFPASVRAPAPAPTQDSSDGAIIPAFTIGSLDLTIGWERVPACRAGAFYAEVSIRPHD